MRVVSLASLTVETTVRGVRPATLRPLPPAAHPAAAIVAAAVRKAATHGAGSTDQSAVGYHPQPPPAAAFDPGSGAVALAAVGAGQGAYTRPLFSSTYSRFLLSLKPCITHGNTQ